MTTANTYANILMPIMGNMGNILYVLLAIVGGSLAIAGVTNISLTGAGVMTLGTIASFLTMSKSFINPIAQVSQQLNAVIMALAGATRIFELLDEEPEEDHGYVTLVNAKRENGELVECKERTGLWAWKHPHSDGTLTYEELKGDVVMEHVDFAVRNIIETVDQVRDCCLTGTCCTDKSDLLPRFCIEVNIMKHQLIFFITKIHMFHDDIAF